MKTRFIDLADKYEGAENIPDEELIGYATRTDVLLAIFRVGDKAPDSLLGRELIRRNQQDPFWYLTFVKPEMPEELQDVGFAMPYQEPEETLPNQLVRNK